MIGKSLRADNGFAPNSMEARAELGAELKLDRAEPGSGGGGGGAGEPAREEDRDDGALPG